jgi:hypothetical protein
VNVLMSLLVAPVEWVMDRRGRQLKGHPQGWSAFVRVRAVPEIPGAVSIAVRPKETDSWTETRIGATDAPYLASLVVAEGRIAKDMGERDVEENLSKYLDEYESRGQ